MLSLRTLRALGLTLAVAIIGTVAASAGTSATTQSAKVRIWVDADRLPAITKVANDWAATKGVTLDIVQKGSDNIRADVKTVQAETAPDLIVGAHDWVGELSSNGSIVPLNPSRTATAGIAKGALDAFSYGIAIKRLYGAPLYTENVALITNTKLAQVPKTWASLEAQALAAKKKLKQKVGIAVQQGNGDAYHMYPFFTGTCGYIFGRNAAGNLDPSDIGVANPKFLKIGAPEIDRWNKVGLINSSVTDGIAKQLFLTGKAAYYVTGPWFLDDIKKSGLKFAVSAFPDNKCTTTPFTGVGGLMVTKFAATHGVESLAKDFAANYMLQAGPQFAHYSVGGRLPVNLKATLQIKDPFVKGFALSGAKGIAMPNIPQMNSVWQDLGQAWVRSTKGAGAMPARKSFIGAQRAIAQKIG
jgi:arabinogalactan oligomer/maltooligosaccharide transport system substrate-binding protein